MTSSDSMSENAAEQWRETVETVYRSESRRVLATLIRLLGDFDLAEEALQDAFAAAVAQWPRAGVPDNPRAWLVSAGRFKAIDAMRRRARSDAALGVLAEQLDSGTSDFEGLDDRGLEDDRLRLIFTCCHPALPRDAQVALTLPLPPRWPSGSCAPRPRFAMSAYHTRCRRQLTYLTGWKPCSRWYTWFSTKATPPRPASR